MLSLGHIIAKRRVFAAPCVATIRPGKTERSNVLTVEEAVQILYTSHAVAQGLFLPLPLYRLEKPRQKKACKQATVTVRNGVHICASPEKAIASSVSFSPVPKSPPKSKPPTSPPPNRHKLSSTSSSFNVF